MDIDKTYLRLGPIVGHTDHQSTRIWVRAHGDPTYYQLRVEGRGLFPFVSTGGDPAWATAVAIVDGLQPSRRYRYHVVCNGRILVGSRGSVRTMPDPASLSEVTFVVISCNDQREEGAWWQLQEFIQDNPPHFILMVGDQVYMDQNIDPTDIWDRHRESSSRTRLLAMAQKYQASWSRDFVQELMANTPTYMVWDDHDIRDGWGSWAPDSPTLADKYHLGRRIFAKHDAYFADARDAYWAFQMSHNPPPAVNVLNQQLAPQALPLAEPPPTGIRQAMPFTFRCGRVGVVVLDSRGDRDLWRADKPVLGAAQWQFLDDILVNLDPLIDALIIATPVPIVTHSAEGQVQTFLGKRTDDVELFKDGDEEGLLALMSASNWSPDNQDPVDTAATYLVGKPAADFAGTLVSAHAADFGWSLDLGGYRLADIDDVRDQWSNVFSRPEQEQLIRWAGRARLANRASWMPRAVLFAGGDLHAGGLFDITSEEPAFTIPSLFSSGISRDSPVLAVSVTVDEDFEVAPGINANLKKVVTGYNFGVVQVIPTGTTPTIVPSVVHWGTASTKGIDAGLHEFPFGKPDLPLSMPKLDLPF